MKRQSRRRILTLAAVAAALALAAGLFLALARDDSPPAVEGLDGLRTTLADDGLSWQRKYEAWLGFIDTAGLEPTECQHLGPGDTSLLRRLEAAVAAGDYSPAVMSVVDGTLRIARLGGVSFSDNEWDDHPEAVDQTTIWYLKNSVGVDVDETGVNLCLYGDVDLGL